MKKFKITIDSPVILGFTLLSLIALLIGMITDDRSTDLLFSTYHSSLASPLTYLRFFTHVLGHAGIEHFIGNIALLLLIGPVVEDKYGSLKLFEVIAITAFVIGLFNYIVFPNVALCGASGVVFALILMTSFIGFKEGEIPLTLILVVIIYIGEQVYDACFVQDNVSNMSHILGGIIGALFGYASSKKK